MPRAAVGDAGQLCREVVIAVRILVLSNWFPYPTDNGARIRTNALLRQLARWHELSLISFTRDGDGGPRACEEVGTFCRVLATVPYQRAPVSRLRSISGLFSTLPRALVTTQTQEMQACIQRALDRYCFDLVMASEIGPGLGVSTYLPSIKEMPCVVEDLEPLMIWGQIRAQRTTGGKARCWLTWLKHRQYTIRLLKRVEGCTVPSEPERELVNSLLPTYQRVAIVPNGVDVARYRGDWGSPISDTLIFPGALTYAANFEAMAFFLSEVFPLIHGRRPGVRLYITGRTDGVALHRLPRCEGVEFTGYVEDIRPLIAQSWVCVLPILTGGGTRIKALEAMALGTPVVSTSTGIEGLEVRHGEHALVADEPAEFAEVVVQLLGDPALRSRLAANGRELVATHYTWEQSGAALDTFLRQVVERG